jgi:nitrile hydratase
MGRRNKAREQMIGPSTRARASVQHGSAALPTSQRALPRPIIEDPMAGHDHTHEHDADDHDHGSELSEMQLRVRALETILTEKGYVDSKALDAIVESYETKIGPHIGARLVAKAWVDPAFRNALLEDASMAASSLGMPTQVGDHVIAVENTDQVHNLVVCTLCSCYPWDVLGLPPVWYKSAPYRARAVRDPRGVLADFGTSLAPDAEIRVWDSTAETRFIVLPQRPAGTDGWSEEQLMALVTRDSMIGVVQPKSPAEVTR